MRVYLIRFYYLILVIFIAASCAKTEVVKPVSLPKTNYSITITNAIETNTNTVVKIKKWLLEIDKTSLSNWMKNSGKEILDANFAQELFFVREGSIAVLGDRLASKGVTNSVIKRVGKARIEIALMEDISILDLDLLSFDFGLQFRLMDETSMKALSEYIPGYKYKPIPTNFGNPPNIDRFVLPEGSEWVAFYEPDTNGNLGLTGWYVLSTNVELDGNDVKSATKVTNDQLYRTDIFLRFTDEGTKKFAAVTKANIMNRLAVVINGRVRSAPVIRQAITGGRAMLTGNFTLKETTDMINLLNSGSLPVKLKYIKPENIEEGSENE